MIRNAAESESPDVDRLMAEAGRPAPVLEYRSAEVDHLAHWRVLGRLMRRIAFTAAWATLAGGIGLSLDRRGEGAFMMAMGAGVLSLFFPVPGARRRTHA